LTEDSKTAGNAGLCKAGDPVSCNEDLDIEIEYQTETISRFGLDFDGNNFLLTTKHTNCLANDHCGIPPEKNKNEFIRLASISKYLLHTRR